MSTGVCESLKSDPTAGLPEVELAAEALLSRREMYLPSGTAKPAELPAALAQIPTRPRAHTASLSSSLRRSRRKSWC